MAAFDILHPASSARRLRCAAATHRLLRLLAPATPLARLSTTRLCLPAGRVLAFDRTSCVTALDVERGAVWITTTPAEGDVVVRAGASFEVRDGWPLLVQALLPTDLVVTRACRAGAPGGDGRVVGG